MLKVVVGTTLGLTAGAVVGSVIGSVVTVGLLAESDVIRSAIKEALTDKIDQILFGDSSKKLYPSTRPTVTYNFGSPYRPR